MESQTKSRRNNNETKADKNGFQNGSTLKRANECCKCHHSNGLHHYNCIPDHLRFNRFVHSGYRVDLSTSECLKSLFYLHNESFNIYSHGR